MKLNSYKKGSNYERKICKILSEAFDIELRRVPCSGALDIVGDVRVKEGTTAKILEPYTIECKKQEKINIWKCNKQAQDQAGETGKIGLLIFSRNREKDYVCLKLNDFINILKGE